MYIAHDDGASGACGHVTGSCDTRAHPPLFHTAMHDWVGGEEDKETMGHRTREIHYNERHRNNHHVTGT